MEDTWSVGKSLHDDATEKVFRMHLQHLAVNFGRDSWLCAFTCFLNAVVAGRWLWKSESAIVLRGSHNFHHQLTLLFVQCFLRSLRDHFSLTTPLHAFRGLSTSLLLPALAISSFLSTPLSPYLCL
jgi:hypothetical protein